MPGNIRLYGTTGYVELAAPATGNNATLTLPTDSIQPGAILLTSQTFSSASSVSINNCFTSAYENYSILINYQSGIVNDYLGFRLRASSTDNSTTNYFYGIAEQNFDASTLTARTNEASASRARVGFTGSVGNRGGVVIQMMDPQVSAHTIWNLQATSGTKGMFGGGDFQATTQFDGFTIYSEGASTITGNARVYGYRNS